MRVLHVMPFLDPVYGGPPIFVRDLIRGLAKAGVRSTLVTTQCAGEHIGDEAGLQDVVTFPCEWSSYRFSHRLLIWLMRNVSSFDVLHVHYLFTFPSFAAAAIARWHKIPYVVQPHGVLNIWGLRNRRPTLKRAWLRCFELPLLRSAATVLYASAEEADEARLTYPSTRSHILPYAVRPPNRCRRELSQVYCEKRVPGELRVLFLSRLDPKKGLELLLTAWATIVSRFPSAVLLIAGSGPPPYERSLRLLASRYGIEKSVEFPGFVSGDDRWPALAAADVFVLPSWSESFCIAALESMSVGTPVVLSDRVALSNAVREADAGLVTPCTVEGITCAITTALADASLRRRLGYNAMQLARRFLSIDAVALRLMTIYGEIKRCSDSAYGR